MNKTFVVRQAYFFCKKHICILGIVHSLSSTAYGSSQDRDDFLKQIDQMNYVSLIFVGQDLSSPVSSFGHILLAFHREVLIEPEALTVEYHGDFQAPFFLIRSLFWSVPGVFRMRSWNKRFWEYEKEDRDIWVIPLRLEYKEKQQLITEIKTSLDQVRPYNFFLHNCASYLLKILRKSVNATCPGKLYTSPMGVLQSLYKCQRIDGTIYMPSGMTRLTESVENLNAQDKILFKQLISQKKSTHYNYLKSLSQEASISLKTSITEWIDYKIPRTNQTQDKAQLIQLREHYHHPLPSQHKDLTEIYSPRSSRLTLQYWQRYRTLLLTFSPAQMRFLSALNNSLWADQFEVLTFGLGFNFSSKKLFLSHIKLLDISTNTTAHIMKIPFAKDVYLGYQKYSIGTKGSVNFWEHLQARLGGGLAYALTDYWKFVFLAFGQTGVVGDKERKYFSIGGGITGRMFLRFSSWMRLKTQFHQVLIDYNTLIPQIGQAQLVFYDYKSFVASLDYEIFHVKKEDQWHHSLGASLSYLF